MKEKVLRLLNSKILVAKKMLEHFKVCPDAKCKPDDLEKQVAVFNSRISDYEELVAKISEIEAYESFATESYRALYKNSLEHRMEKDILIHRLQSENEALKFKLEIHAKSVQLKCVEDMKKTFPLADLSFLEPCQCKECLQLEENIAVEIIPEVTKKQLEEKLFEVIKGKIGGYGGHLKSVDIIKPFTDEEASKLYGYKVKVIP